MNLRTARALCVSFFLSVLPVSAFALAGDAAAILAHCGPPSSDQVIHQDTPQMERVIAYSDIELVFASSNNDWSFTHATRASMPLPQDALFASMHCVSDALEEISAAPPQLEATVNQPSAETASASAAREKVFVAVAIVVLLGVLFFAIRPYTRSEVARPATTVAPRAPQRRPSATGIKFRKPEDTNPSGVHPVPRNDSTNEG
jgi:hypothetical protein